MAYQIFRLLFVRTTGTDLQHDLQHGLQHNRKKLKFHRLFELSVQSIIGATERREADLASLLIAASDSGFALPRLPMASRRRILAFEAGSSLKNAAKTQPV